MRFKVKLLHKFILLMILLAVVPLLLVSFGFKPLNFQGLVSINRLTLEDAILELHIHLAESLSEKIDDYINNIKRNLNFIITSQRLDIMSWREKEAVLRSLLVANEDFVSVAILDNQGDAKIKAYNPAYIDEPEIVGRFHDPVFQNAIKEKDFQISDLFYEGDDPRLNIVYNLGSDQIMFITLALNSLWEKVLSIRLGETGYAFLVNDIGKIICHPDIKMAKSFTPATNLDIVKEVLLRKVLGSKEYIDSAGKYMVGAYASINSLNWGIIIQQPKDEAFITAIRMRKNAIILIFIMVFVASMAAFYMARRLSGPLIKLIDGARKVAAGDFDHEVKVKTHDELGDLADTFNQMTRRLRAYNDMQVEKIFAEQKKLDAVIFSISDGIIMTDLSAKIMLINEQAKRILDIKDTDTEGKNIWDYLKENKIMESFEEILRERGKTVLKEIDLSEEGHRKILKTGTNVVKSRKGEDLGLVTVLHDITLEKELEQLKDDFLHAITHDLRSPMTSIRGYIEVILDGMAGELNPQQEKFLKIVDQSSERLLGMINNILDVAKLEAGKMPINLSEFDIRELVEGIIVTLEPQSKKKGLEVTAEYITQELMLKADKTLLERVIINLVTNAIKFTSVNGSVKIRIDEVNNGLEISVIDTGEGIPAEFIDKIFDKFQQVSGKEKRGTGLGLAITKYIIEAHLGNIKVESEEGKGSKFIFWIPKGLEKDREDKILCRQETV